MPKKKVEVVADKVKTVKDTRVPTEISLPLGVYSLHDLMVRLGYPGFVQDFHRLFEKGIVKVNGDVVLADETHEIGEVDIEIDDKLFHVVALVEPEAEAPKEGKWSPSLGEKFDLNGEIAEVTSLDPLQVVVHEVANGCQTTREIAVESLDGATCLDPKEAFRRLAG